MGYELGVDVGTTFTAAAVRRGDGVEMVGLGNRALQMPTVVFVADDASVLVGEAAENRGTGDPVGVAREFKRRLGDPVPILVRGRPYSPELLTATVLRAVLATTAEREGGLPDGVTVTHPANWGPYKLELLQQALSLADCHDARTCAEPVAAAITYSRRQRVDDGDAIAVYDLGGGTFDTAVLRHVDGEFQVVGRPEGIEHLGGVDVDEVVFRHVLGSLSRPVDQLDPDDPDVVVALARLRRDCVLAKEQLSSDTQATVTAALPGGHETVRLGRGELEELIQPALEETVAAVRRALRSADVAPDDLSAVVLVGGSSRIPLVSEVLAGAFGRPLAVDTHPKHDVALGAAWYDSAPTVAPVATPEPRRLPRIVPRPLPSGVVRRAPRTAPPAIPSPGVPFPPVATSTPADVPPSVDPPSSSTPWAPDPALAPEPEPVVEAVVEPVPEPVLEPVLVVEPVLEPVAEPVLEPVPDVVLEAEGSEPPPDAPLEPVAAAPHERPLSRRRKRGLWAALGAVAAAAVTVVVVLATGAFGDPADNGRSAAGGASASPSTSRPRSVAGRPASATPLAADVMLYAQTPADHSTSTLRTVSLDGTQTATIRTLPGVASAVLSHDRRTIAYILRPPGDSTTATDAGVYGQIMLMSADGSKVRPLVSTGNPPCNAPEPPAFGPNDDELAVVCGDAGNATLSVVDTHGKTIVALDTGVSGPPSFSPDGSRVAYAKPSGDTSSIDTVTNDAAHTVTPATPAGGHDQHPAFSPDGTTLLFDREAPLGPDIFSVVLEGGQEVRLTSATDSESYPDFAPGDPSRITYVRADAVWIMAADGTDQHPLTS